MQVKVGKSLNSDAASAVKEATAGMSTPAGIFFQSPFSQIKEVSKLLSKQFPNTPIIGTGATSYYGSGAGCSRRETGPERHGLSGVLYQ